jgi:hypothetical protein
MWSWSFLRGRGQPRPALPQPPSNQANGARLTLGALHDPVSATLARAGLEARNLRHLALASKNLRLVSRLATGSLMNIDLDNATFDGQRTPDGFRRIIWSNFTSVGPTVRIRNMRTAGDATLLATLPRSVSRIELVIAVGLRDPSSLDYLESTYLPSLGNLGNIASNLVHCPWVKELCITIQHSDNAVWFRMSDLATPGLEHLDIKVTTPTKTTAWGIVGIHPEVAPPDMRASGLKFFRLRSMSEPDGWDHIRQFLAANARTLQTIDLGTTDKTLLPDRVDQLDSLVTAAGPRQFAQLTSLRLAVTFIPTLSKALSATEGAREAPLVQACPQLRILDVAVLSSAHTQGGDWSPQVLPGQILTSLTVRLVGPPFDRVRLADLKLKSGQALTVHAYSAGLPPAGLPPAFKRLISFRIEGAAGDTGMKVTGTSYGSSYANNSEREHIEMMLRFRASIFGWPQPTHYNHIAID